MEKNEILPLSERSRVAAAKNVVYGGSDEKEMTGKKRNKASGDPTNSCGSVFALMLGPAREAQNTLRGRH